MVLGLGCGSLHQAACGGGAACSGGRPAVEGYRRNYLASTARMKLHTQFAEGVTLNNGRIRKTSFRTFQHH